MRGMALEAHLTEEERTLLCGMNSPRKIQDFLWKLRQPGSQRYARRAL